MTLRIAIHSAINPREAGGAQTSTVSLVRALKAHVSDVHATLIGPPAVEAALREIASPEFNVCAWRHTFPWYRKTVEEEARVEVADAGTEARQAAEQEILRVERDATLRGLGAEVLHFPYQVTFDSELPTIYEPWDLQHLVLPDLFTPGERKWRTALFSRACARASLVVVATHASKKDLVSLLGVPAGKIAVIPRDSRRMEIPVSDEARKALLAEMKVSQPFVFYPAMTFGHKNHVKLIEALALLRDRKNLVIPLVCSGRKHAPFWPTVEEALVKYQLEKQVHFVGAVTDEQLAALFSSTTALAFPSRFEGLGLPLLEAMQFGVPIAASNTSCIPEVVGDAALLFDQEDPEAIAMALERLWKDEALRHDLSAKALVRRRTNTWDEAAKTFIAVYRHCAGRDVSSEDRSRIERSLAAQ
jgi:glycosyltransferase involved in cell wall biosynthesis